MSFLSQNVWGSFRDSWPLQDGIKDLSSLHPVTAPNCLTRRALVMSNDSSHVTAR